MDFTAKENIPGLLLFIDFQKAFDSVEWEFLIESLKKFNFGRDFLQWVKTFYSNIQSCVINNGVSSNFFTLERGVRQGDPLSPYLFIIAVETLAIAIRQKESIKGITIGTEETKLLQFADDTTAVLADTSSAARFYLNYLTNSKFSLDSRLTVQKLKVCGLDLRDIIKKNHSVLNGRTSQ